MQGYGENIECLVVAGFYGSGKRGGGISSYMCGLRTDEPGNPQKFKSFFKVGGGMKADDYAAFKHMTDGKWHDYDPIKPPAEYLELSGAPKEKPDVGIKPEDSFVVQAKAAEIVPTDEFAMGLTLRFPRFVRLRQDRDWQTTLSVSEFLNLKKSREDELNKKFEVAQDQSKKRKLASRVKPLKVVGYGAEDANEIKIDNTALSGAVFEGLTFFVMTDSIRPTKKTKPQLEAMIKAHGGKIVQTHAVKDTEKVHCIAERRTVKVASLQKKGDVMLIKPIWLFDCIDQAKTDFANGMMETVLCWEIDRHLFYVPEDERPMYEGNVDQYGDAYFRDTTVEELRELISKMMDVPKVPKVAEKALANDLRDCNLPGWMFRGMRMFFDVPTEESMNEGRHSVSKEVHEMQAVQTTATFAGTKIATEVEDETITHIVVSPSSDLKALRKMISRRRKIPRLVTATWISESWQEKTLIDEERYVPRL